MRTEVEEFRHRGFQDSDDHSKFIEVFGDGPEPVDANGKPLKKLWDNDIKSVKTVSEHVPKDGTNQ